MSYVIGTDFMIYMQIRFLEFVCFTIKTVLRLILTDVKSTSNCFLSIKKYNHVKFYQLEKKFQKTTTFCKKADRAILM